MTETFSARMQADPLRRQLDEAQARADEQEAVVRRLKARLAAGDGTVSQGQADAAAARLDDLTRAADDLRGQLSTAEDALTQALDADPPLFGSPSTEPIVLLPVRLETIWTDPRTIRVRVYPDDIHLSGFGPELTPAEAEAGAAYWRSPGPDAWREVSARLRPARAAWAVRATRPGGPPPVIQSGEQPPPTAVQALPGRWRFVGLVAGEVVVDAIGRPIPDPLPAGLRDGDLGWEVDWFHALKAGMGIELQLPVGVDHLDQLLVTGVSDGPAAAGASRLRDLLLGHAFGGGLGLLGAGTPTNNTPGSRSGWSSRPSFPAPGDADPPPGQHPVADDLATALGLTDAGFLRLAAGADNAEPAAVAGLSLLTWGSLGKGFADAAVTHYELVNGPVSRVRAVDSGRPWRMVRDQLADHVRSRGPLPTLRIGRQPYGVLPASSLSDWRADRDRDPDALIVPWLRRLRERWRAALDDSIPRVRPGQPADQVAVDVLERLPVASGMSMRRMFGPAFTFPRTSPEDPPNQPGLPGLSPDGGLRWTTASDGWTDLGWGIDRASGRPGFAARLAPGPATFAAAAVATADRLRDARAFLTGQLSAADYDRNWPVELSSRDQTPARRATFWQLADGAGVLPALLFLPVWSSMAGDDGADDPVRQALAVPDEVDQLVTDVLDHVSDNQRNARITAAAQWAPAMTRLEAALRAVAAVPAERLPELLAEVIDVYTHRLDAWVTSLASLRLSRQRAAGVTGARTGGYGWLEDLRPAPPGEQVDLGEDDGVATVSAQDGYIHAPSLQHAATAAVLRSGFLAHPGEQTFAVNLSSRRARLARWLLGGVRQGQSLGTLLGYRFERALHDAGLDAEIERFRLAFPAPAVPEPPALDGDAGSLWSHSTEAIAARNVVDGMALARAGADARQIAADPSAVGPVLDELADALDAAGDLVLAESVHHLVGGNALRAGLAADTLGRGEDVPDTFYSLRTPHRARAVTTRLAALLPATTSAPAAPGAPAGPDGWTADPVAALEPAVEAWAAGLLGPAAGWTLAGVAGQDQPFTITAERLGLGALSTMIEAATAPSDRLRDALRQATGTAPSQPVALTGGDWPELRTLATRMRALLTGAQPVLPAHLPGGEASGPVDLTETRARLAAFAADPMVTAHPAGPAVASLVTAAAPGGDPAAWLAQARAALAGVLGADVPLLPRLPVPPPAGRPGTTGAQAGEWLARYATVRPTARALHEALLLCGARTRRWDRLQVAQAPDADGDAWIGGPFPADRRPAARTHLVWHQPAPLAGPAAGLLLDEWTEPLPGADRLREAVGPASPDPAPPDPAAPGTAAPGTGLAGPGPAGSAPPESELTGVTFHYDRPDAKAPQTILIAVPPDTDRGWTANGLLQVLLETLELAKLRAIDPDDMALMRALLPAIRMSPEDGTGQELTAVETPRPGNDPAGPFRFEPGYRTDSVEPGLAARIHDPLWLLTRQWQFGEFGGQDAGSPALVRLRGTSAPIDAWRPAVPPAPDDPPGPVPRWIRFDARLGPLDAPVEAEPFVADERTRAEGGAHLLRMLDDAGLLAAADGALGPLLLGQTGGDSPANGDSPADDSPVGLLGGRMPDAAAVAAAVDAGTLPAGLAPVTGPWRQWWAAAVADRGPDCFDPHRFEHGAAFSGAGVVLAAPEYLGDGLDWFSVDLDLDSEPAAQRPGYPFADEAIPSPVRFTGLPADRFWEMEDAQIDLAAADVSALDTGRLLLIAFATVYGNDWFLVPLEVPGSSLTLLDQLVVRDVFDRSHLVRRAGRDDTDWTMFTPHSPDPQHPAAGGLVMLPAGAGQPGAVLERVLLARDELANLAWAVQHSYTDGRGEPVDRREAWLRAAPEPAPAGPLPVYGVQTIVPDYWFPLVPVPVTPSVIRFKLAPLTGPGLTARPEGRLVAEGLWVHEEEVPRDGAAVIRRPVLARWFDGSWHRWIRREKSAGTGGSSSGLAFDTVRPSEPWPG